MGFEANHFHWSTNPPENFRTGSGLSKIRLKMKNQTLDVDNSKFRLGKDLKFKIEIIKAVVKTTQLIAYFAYTFL